MEDKRTLDEVLFDFRRDTWPFLLKVSVVYFAYHFFNKPEDSVVFVLEYIKIPPSLCVEMVLFLIPLALAIQLARTMVYFWLGAGNAILELVFMPVYFLFRVPLFMYNKFYVKKENYFFGEVALSDLEKYKSFRSKFENRKRLISNYIFISILFLYFTGSIIGNQSKVEKTEIQANMHYFCQIKSNYEQDNCSLWKKQWSNLTKL